MEIEVEPIRTWVSEYSATTDWKDACTTLHKAMIRKGVDEVYSMYDAWFNQNEIGRMWKCFEAAPSTAARKIVERYSNNMYAREDFCMLYLCLQEIDKEKNRHTVPRAVLTEEEVKAKLQIYFNAQFRGIGRTAVFNYFDALVPRLMLPRESVKEQATIAMMIYNDRKSIMTADAPQTFGGWYRRLCEVLGWKFDKNYKPNKLEVKDKLKEEFYFL